MKHVKMMQKLWMGILMLVLLFCTQVELLDLSDYTLYMCDGACIVSCICTGWVDAGNTTCRDIAKLASAGLNSKHHTAWMQTCQPL